VADKKITDLANKATPAPADIVPIVDPTDNTTKRTTVGGLATAVMSSLVSVLASSSNLGSRAQTLTASGSGTVAYSTNNPTIELKPGTYMLFATASSRAVIAGQDSSFEAAIYNNTTSTELVFNGAGNTGVSLTAYPNFSVSTIVTPSANTTYSGRARQTFGSGATYSYVHSSLIAIPLLVTK